MKKLWFLSKRYGWGWTPVTWQGWAVTLIYVLLMLGTASMIDRSSHSASDMLLVVVPLWILLTIAMIAVCYATGEKPRWRWGN